jgi:hypothetical protein
VERCCFVSRSSSLGVRLELELELELVALVVRTAPESTSTRNPGLIPHIAFAFTSPDTQLDNTKLSTSEAVYTSHGAAVEFPGESVRVAALKLVRERGLHAEVTDLDDHLDDS